MGTPHSEAAHGQKRTHEVGAPESMKAASQNEAELSTPARKVEKVPGRKKKLAASEQSPVATIKLMQPDTHRSRRMSDQDDLVRVSSKLGNVVPDPLERHQLVLERDVEVEFRSGSSRDVRCRWRRARFGRARREAECAEAVAVRANVRMRQPGQHPREARKRRKRHCCCCWLT